MNRIQKIILTNLTDYKFGSRKYRIIIKIPSRIRYWLREKISEKISTEEILYNLGFYDKKTLLLYLGILEVSPRQSENLYKILVDLTVHREWRIKCSSLRLLKDFQNHKEEVLDIAEKLLENDSDWSVRDTSLTILTQSGDNTRREKAILQAINDKVVLVRISAVESLKSDKEHVVFSMKILLIVLYDKERFARSTALKYIEKEKIEDLRTEIKKIANNDLDKSIRKLARKILNAWKEKKQ